MRSVPQVLVLNDCGIDQAGSAEDLKKKCNSVKELDLAQNKLENWNEVICTESETNLRRPVRSCGIDLFLCFTRLKNVRHKKKFLSNFRR